LGSRGLPDSSPRTCRHAGPVRVPCVVMLLYQDARVKVEQVATDPARWGAPVVDPGRVTFTRARVRHPRACFRRGSSPSSSWWPWWCGQEPRIAAGCIVGRRQGGVAGPGAAGRERTLIEALQPLGAEGCAPVSPIAGDDAVATSAGGGFQVWTLLSRLYLPRSSCPGLRSRSCGAWGPRRGPNPCRRPGRDEGSARVRPPHLRWVRLAPARGRMGNRVPPHQAGLLGSRRRTRRRIRGAPAACWPSAGSRRKRMIVAPGKAWSWSETLPHTEAQMRSSEERDPSVAPACRRAHGCWGGC